MLIRRLTMRGSMGITIAVMGLLGLALALTTGEIYRQQTLNGQRAAGTQLLRLKSDDLLRDLESRSRDLGLNLQHGAEFRRAFKARDPASMSRLLDRQFHQYFTTIDVLRLMKLQVFDAHYAPIAESTDGAPGLSGRSACPEVIEAAQKRRGLDRIKVISALCRLEDQIYHVVTVPIGGLRPAGYLQVTTDPVHSLALLETMLRKPIKMKLADGKLVYRSKEWLPPEFKDQILVTDYPLQTSSTGPVLTVEMMDDIRPLNRQLAKARYLIMMVSGVIILMAAAVALLMLQYTTVRPLMALHDQLRGVRRDRSRLGQTLTPDGTIELRELALDFNALSTELRDLHQTLERTAFTDALTGLPNRAWFHRQLHENTKDSPRRSFALFVMDLDRFKEVNDTFGHDIGDQLLKRVSARLNGVLRRNDGLACAGAREDESADKQVIARLGGDEFAAILPGFSDAQETAVVAQMFLQAMEQAFLVGAHRFHVGLSIGLALYPLHGTDPSTLLRQADIAMYQAKQGKRGYAFFDSVRDNHKLRQLTLERDLRQAIETDMLELHYQPIIDIRASKVSCVETLVRWRYPDSEFASPDEFIRIAEQCGLIQPLTRWVLDHAVEHCSRWRAAGFAVDVAVNLSVMNLHEPDLADYVMGVLRKWGAEPSWLSLELTESAVMSDPGHALEVVSRLDAMGVRISIDDFGTGYSSLAYLKRMPVDEIKIDKSFVIDMKRDNNDAVIVRSTIDLAHNMSLQVAAEGVENPETLRLLSALGCDKVQGFYISRPQPYDSLLKWLGSSTWSIQQRPGDQSAGRRRMVVSLRRPTR